eukprot:CAMPEP_0204517562 /NCGR_PEP_ID=MMETSP0661-20131031/3735_1 /ASSEMBLY_ACC=CAM_ASM_000606 /TAXON_ID=109239 /ORGANISM="Alexandrium margalefi, Strain AMGDE01CS-322" /LENGTH=72 /DNA_ID=CAMNT_0051522965 /DNA_START=109 /DNA_END=327 /DNA_ORIENTATION=+
MALLALCVRAPAHASSCLGHAAGGSGRLSTGCAPTCEASGSRVQQRRDNTDALRLSRDAGLLYSSGVRSADI